MKRTGVMTIRDILRHRHDLGLARAQIAAAVGVSAGTVSNILDRAAAALTWPLPADLDEPTPLRLSPGHLQPRARPQALDPLVVDLPAGVAQQGGHPPVAVAVIPPVQLDHVGDQAVLVIAAAWDTALAGAVLPQHPAAPTLRDPEPVTDMVDAPAVARGAQKFPGAASFSICLCSVGSETPRRNCSFSFSSSFRRRSWSPLIPPYSLRHP